MLPYSAAGTPLATAALSRRAPSRWTTRPSSRAVSATDDQLLERPHTPAGAAMRLLEHDDARRLQVVGDPHDVAQLVRCDPTAVARQRMRHEPRVHGGAARLEDEHVRPLLCDQLSAAFALAEERDLVRHRRRRQEQRLLLAEQLGGAPLQLVDRRILPQLLVAHVRGRHRSAHLGGRLRGRVGAKIDHRAILAARWTWPAGGDARRPRRAGIPRRPGVAVGRARRSRLRSDDERARRAAARRSRRTSRSRRSRSRPRLARRTALSRPSSRRTTAIPSRQCS